MTIHHTPASAADDAETRASRASSKPAAPAAAPDATGTQAAPHVGGRLLDRLDSAERKEYPMATGLMDYFPDALAVVSNVSWRGNQKHNPGQPPHWSRQKSSDHADCVVRHMATRADMDGKVLHLAEAAWRVLADLQITLEERHKLSLPSGAIPPR